VVQGQGGEENFSPLTPPRPSLPGRALGRGSSPPPPSAAAAPPRHEATRAVHYSPRRAPGSSRRNASRVPSAGCDPFAGNHRATRLHLVTRIPPGPRWSRRERLSRDASVPNPTADMRRFPRHAKSATGNIWNTRQMRRPPRPAGEHRPVASRRYGHMCHRRLPGAWRSPLGPGRTTSSVVLSVRCAAAPRGCPWWRAASWSPPPSSRPRRRR